MDSRRVSLALLLLGSTIAIGAALYFFFFRTPPTPKIFKKPPLVSQPSALPQSGPASPTAPLAPTPESLFPAVPTPRVVTPGIADTNIISDHRTKALVASTSGSISFYDATEGTFYGVDSNGKKQKLTNETFFDVQDVAWAPDQNKAVLEFPDGHNIVYNFATKQQMTLPPHWSKFQFSPSGTQIAAMSKGIHESQNWLLTVNADGTNARGIEPLGKNADKVIVSWNKGGEIVAFSRTGDPQGGEANEIYLIGQNGENFKSLIVDGYDFTPQWSADGKQLLYSTYSSRNDYKPVLWLVDADGAKVGANRRELKINTWADKCVIKDAHSVLCAVPQELPNGAGFTREVAQNTPDSFYLIDTNTGLKTKLAVPTAAVSAQSLQLSGDQSTLFYQNTLTGNIESLKLK